MIKNIKLKVTPEQSHKVQEICFSKGIVWKGAGTSVQYTEAPYLYIEDKRWTQISSSKLTVLELENY